MADVHSAAAWNARAEATRAAIRDMNAHDIVALRRQCLDTVAQLLAGPCAALAARYSAHRAAPAATEPWDSSWLGANNVAGWCSAWLAEADAAGATRKRALDEWLRAFCEFAGHVCARTQFMPTADADTYYAEAPRDVFFVRRSGFRAPHWACDVFRAKSNLTFYDSGVDCTDAGDAERELLDRVFLCMRCRAAVVDVDEDFFASPSCILELLLLGGHDAGHIFFYSDHVASYVCDFTPGRVYNNTTLGAMLGAVCATASAVAGGTKRLNIWGKPRSDYYMLRSGDIQVLKAVLGDDVARLLAVSSQPGRAKDVDEALHSMVGTVSVEHLQMMFDAARLTRYWPALLAALFPPP